MNRKIAILVFTILLLSINKIYGQITFEIDVPKMVYQGERFAVKFVANAKIDNFNGPSFSGATVLAGPSPSTMSSVQIVNGKRTSQYEESYTYILQAGDQNVIAISSANASISGKQYNSKPVTIEVVSSSSTPAQSYQREENQDEGITYNKADLFLNLSLNKTKVVKGEPIIATLKLYTRSNIAGFEDFKLPIFNGFWSQDIEAPNNISFTTEKVGDQIYRSALLRRFVIIPQQSGNLTIEPAELVCQVQIAQRGTRGRSIFDDFFGDDTYSMERKRLSTGRKNIEVSPLPSEAPNSFGGGVGKINMNVKLAHDSLKSNQATSLIVELAGSGNLNLMEQPKVILPSDFESYDVKVSNNFSNTAQGVTGKRVFEYPFIPRGEGVYQIEPIEYSYYDIQQKKYVTLTSEPKELKVLKGDVSQGIIVSSTNQREVGNLGEDIRYIKNRTFLSEKEKNFIVSSLFYYLIIVLVAVLAFVALYILKQRKTFNSDIVRVRNKRANRVANSRLRQAQTYLKENKVQEFYEELHKAMLGYVSDKLSIPYAQMQKSTIESLLISKGIDNDKVDEFIKLLDSCELVRYSPQGADSAMESKYNKARELISLFENKL